MTVRIRIPQFLSRTSGRGTSRGPSASPVALAAAPAHSTFHAALTDSAEDWVIRGAPSAAFTPRPAASPAQAVPDPAPAAKSPGRPAKSQAQGLGPGMLVRGWSWLHAKYTQTATKRLRVSETVSLGEKRFVSIVRVEDREFLIGGGASGVSLLAQLGAVPESAAATWPKNVQSIQGGRQ